MVTPASRFSTITGSIRASGTGDIRDTSGGAANRITINTHVYYIHTFTFTYHHLYESRLKAEEYPV